MDIIMECKNVDYSYPLTTEPAIKHLNLQIERGIIFGSLYIALAAVFIFFFKKYNYQGVVFFDTFPIRENAKLETQANINSFEKISKIIDEIGMDRIAEVVSKRDGVEAHRLVLDMLK